MPRGRLKTHKYLYMLVDDTPLELPLMVEETAQDLADKLGVKATGIMSSCLRQERGDYKHSRYVRVLYE